MFPFPLSLGFHLWQAGGGKSSVNITSFSCKLKEEKMDEKQDQTRSLRCVSRDDCKTLEM